MKLMIASDIHGSAYWLERLLELWKRENSPRMLLLGDLLYHGPRNDLPRGYAPKQAIELLNGIRTHLFCIRGNCEAEVDQMVLSFPVLAEYCVLPLQDRVLYAVHGHKLGRNDPPPLCAGDVLLCGHTHIPAFEQADGFTYVNPGSVSIPKNGTPHSCILMEADRLRWFDLETFEVWKEETL